MKDLNFLESDGIHATRDLLLRCREALTPEYS